MRLRLLLVVLAALLLGAALPAWAWEDYEKGENAPIVSVPAAPPSPQRLPYFGIMADVGVPDGLIGSVVARPWKWLRLAGGGETRDRVAALPNTTDRRKFRQAAPVFDSRGTVFARDPPALMRPRFRELVRAD